MKYILEILGSNNPYSSRAAGIGALDEYSYHRPGQLISVVYLNDKGERKAILAIGHDYGIGFSISDGKYRYTVIGEADAQNTVVNYNFAKFIKLDRIDYSDLLDDYYNNVTPGHRRFGYLGTEHDSWRDQKAIPTGATVQDAFEQILVGKYKIPEPESSLELSITVNPAEVIVPDQGAPDKYYTVTVNANYDGTMTYAKMTATSGAEPADNILLDNLKNGSYSLTYPVGSDWPIDYGESQIITYMVFVTVDGITKTATGSVKIIKEPVIPPEPSTTYIVKYINFDDTTHEARREGAIPVVLASPPSDWRRPEGYVFDGWYKDNVPTGERITVLSVDDFTPTSVPNTVICYLYASYKEDIPVKQKLVLSADKQTEKYNNSVKTYAMSNISVTAGGIEQNITWNGTLGTGDGFTVSIQAWPSGTDCGTYSETVILEITDTDKWDPEGSSRPATLEIQKRPATICTLLDEKASLTVPTGSSEEFTCTFTRYYFLGSDDQTVAQIENWIKWSPALDMNTAGTYTLGFDDTKIPDNIRRNYDITYVNAILCVEDEEVQVGYKFHGLENWATAVKAEATEDLNSLVRNPSGPALPDKVEGIEGYFVIYYWNYDYFSPETILKTNLQTELPAYKIWDPGDKIWYSGQGSLHPSQDNPGKEYQYYNKSGMIIEKQQGYIALKFD